MHILTSTNSILTTIKLQLKDFCNLVFAILKEMKKIKLWLNYALLILLLAAGAHIAFYYWTITDISDLRNLQNSVLSAIIIYILIQLTKRYFTKKMGWQDWSYYIALIAVLLPLILVKAEGKWIAQIAQFGSLFFLLPPLIDFLLLLKKSKDDKSKEQKENEVTQKQTTNNPDNSTKE